MEWIIFVDLGFIVFLIVMAAILAAVGTAGAVMWIWPAIKIIVGVLFAIVMVVGINHKVIFDYLFKSSYMPV